MKRVSKFQTEDGTLFDNEADAKLYELKMSTLKKLGHVLLSSMRTGRPDAVIRHILEEHGAVGKLLTEYRKRLPREQPARAAA